MPHKRLSALLMGLVAMCTICARAFGDGEAPTPSVPERPAIKLNRWQEDWSVLGDPRLRTEPLDNLKYIPLNPNDPKSYMSLGLTLRERVETNNAPSFGVGNNPNDSYLLQRFQFHADVRPNENWQVFVELEDVRAFWKKIITPVDENPLDLRQAFVTYTGELGEGELKVRIGRQQMAFDLQRFVSIRDGPNVQQAYDAAWVDWELALWRFITFWSFPVQYRHKHPFDDFSDSNLQYGGFRVERQNVGPGSLSAYYSRFMQDNVRYLDAAGDERRNILDVRYAGDLSGFDWDLEAMGQFGSVGGKRVRAWAIGTITGYTFSDLSWAPRLGLQFDAASGDRHPGDGTLETFNPLFPNGYYFTLAGYTSYVNFFHLKPSLTVKPISNVKLMAAVGFQWRQTTADAVYVMPNIPVSGTAGAGGRWSGLYSQLRGEWAITPNLAGAVEVVRFWVADVIRRAGGHDSQYGNVQLLFSW
jgi:Alginate export